MSDSKIIFLVWMVWALVPVVLLLTSVLIGFWTRGDCKPELHIKFQRLKYKNRFKFYGYNNTFDYADSWAYFDIMVGGCVAGATVVFVQEFGFSGLLVLGICALLLVSPRWIRDLWKILQFNNKTGESERINKLERELQELKDKQ